MMDLLSFRQAARELRIAERTLRRARMGLPGDARLERAAIVLARPPRARTLLGCSSARERTPRGRGDPLAAIRAALLDQARRLLRIPDLRDIPSSEDDA